MAKMSKTLLLLAMGASTLGFFGTSFGLSGPVGCNYALNRDYEAMYQTMGVAVLNTVYDTYFKPIGTDYDTFIGQPTLELARDSWRNWVDYRVPDDPTVR